LHADPQHRAETGTEHAEPEPLQQINRERRARRSPEAAQQRHRRQLLADVRMDRAGHADRAEEKRRKADETEKRVHVADALTELAFALFHGVEPEPQFAEARTHVDDQRLDVKIRCELKIHAMPRETARLQQPRIAHRRKRNKYARRERRHRGGFAGHRDQAANHGEFSGAEFHLVADFQAKLGEQTLLQDNVHAGRELVAHALGRGVELTVKRKRPFQCAHLHQSRLPAARDDQHRVKRDFARLLAPEARDKFLRVAVEFSPGSDREIGPEQ
jgi:hypothetical protein